MAGSCLKRECGLSFCCSALRSFPSDSEVPGNLPLLCKVPTWKAVSWGLVFGNPNTLVELLNHSCGGKKEGRKRRGSPPSASEQSP